MGALFGPCCTDVACYTPTDGTCVPLADVASKGITLTKPMGSGTCACNATPPGGPFAVPDTFPAGKEQQPGQCCYTSTYQYCVGRPLFAEGELRVAKLAASSAWLA